MAFGEEGEERSCRTEFCERRRDPRCTRRVNPGVEKRQGPKSNGGDGEERRKRRSRSVCKAARAGEPMA